MTSTVENILEYMSNSLDEASNYVYQSQLVRNEYPVLSQAYTSLANQHLRHYDELKNAISTISIDNDDKVICKYMIDKLIKKYQKIKAMV